MAKRKRNTGRRTAPDDERSGFRRHAAVWLATLSTVIGVATGMFTLRDQVFPREAGTAVAVSVPAYQQRVGDVCDAVNLDDRLRARQDKVIKRKLKHAKTTVQQRNALLDSVRVTASRSGHTLASFTAIEEPPILTPVRRKTQEAWERNLARIRNYSQDLDSSRTRKQLLKAIDGLTAIRPTLGRDADTLRSGLQRLGEANCDLEPPIITSTFTLPPLPKANPQAQQSVTPPSSTGGEAPPAPAPAPPPPAGSDPPPSNSGGGGGGANNPPVVGGGEG
jgi:hypothetical protein